MAKSSYPAMMLGRFPVEIVNRVLNMELEDGDVWLSAAAHKHIADDHPADYQKYFIHIGTAVTHPTFVGQAPGKSDGFEIVYRVPSDGAHMLVAMTVNKNKHGTYNVKSMYLLTEDKVTNRRSSRRLFPAR